MIDRIIRAITFKTDVYREVAADPSFTTSAWIIVAVAQFLSSLGTSAAYSSGFGGFLGNLIVGTLVGVGSFALGAFLISWLAKALFNVTLTFDQVVRPLGLANVFAAIGVINIFAAIIPNLICITGPLSLVILLIGLVAYFMALQKITGLDTVKVIALAVIASIVTFIANSIVNAIF